MVRYRWYRLLTRKEIRNILDIINSLPFYNGVKKGFKISYKSENSVSGIFYHISIFHQENANIDILNSLQFSISEIKGSIYLRIQDPTRNIKEFSNTLFELFDLDLAFEPISISFDNVKEWISFKEHEAKLILIKVSNLKITENIFSEITFKSNDEINISELEVLKDKQYIVDTISWCIKSKVKNYKISVSKSGLVSMSEYLILDFIDYVEARIL